jgi:hypothetical protein
MNNYSLLLGVGYLISEEQRLDLLSRAKSTGIDEHHINDNIYKYDSKTWFFGQVIREMTPPFTYSMNDFCNDVNQYDTFDNDISELLVNLELPITDINEIWAWPTVYFFTLI